MIRSPYGAAIALLALAIAAPPPALAQRTSIPVVSTTTAAPGATAAWSCGNGRCNYLKTQGAPWTDCFTSWSPTHGGWLPTRYCR